MSLAKTIIFGDIHDVKSQLYHGMNLNMFDEYGFTPLIEAAIADKVDIAALLLEYGADPNFKDMLGRTALHWAADNNNLHFCEMLLNHHADPNAYSRAGQSPLVLPLLRKHTELKNLLLKHGANLSFAQDYINGKLIGHRFQIPGHSHIVDHEGNFIVLDFEGFFFEFTSSLIMYSLERFRKNFAARGLKHYFDNLIIIEKIFGHAAELLKYQQYKFNRKNVMSRINEILSYPIQLIPVAYRGHAIAYIKFNDFFIKIDRGEYGRKYGTVLFFKMRQPENFNEQLCKRLLYKRNDERFVHEGIKDYLQTDYLFCLPLTPQISGNCSWANIEAAIPATLMLFELQNPVVTIQESQEFALMFYQQWLEWDKDRAIEEAIQNFHYANRARKAAIAEILANVLVLRCNIHHDYEVERALRILNVLCTPGYEYVLEGFIRTYCKDRKNPIGNNLRHLLDLLPSSTLFSKKIDDVLKAL